MKRTLKTILILCVIGGSAFLAYYFTDLFYPQTKIIVSENESSVLISRLTTEKELNNIKTALDKKDIKLIIKNIVYSGNYISKISVKVLTPYGAEGEFSTNNMRFIRYFTIELNSIKKSLYLGKEAKFDKL